MKRIWDRECPIFKINPLRITYSSQPLEELSLRGII